MLVIKEKGKPKQERIQRGFVKGVCVGGGGEVIHSRTKL